MVNSFSGEVTVLRRTEQTGMFQNGSFSLPLREARGGFSHCENQGEIPELKCTEAPWPGTGSHRGSSSWVSAPVSFSVVAPLWGAVVCPGPSLLSFPYSRKESWCHFYGSDTTFINLLRENDHLYIPCPQTWHVFSFVFYN